MATDEGPLYLLENSNTGVLRSAQDDSIGAFSAACYAGACEPCRTSDRLGLTTSQAAEPRAQRQAAVRKDAVHPNLWANTGVRTAVTALPTWAPIFTKPESEPEERPPKSAESAQ